jgi:hypothetical protein
LFGLLFFEHFSYNYRLRNLMEASFQAFDAELTSRPYKKPRCFKGVCLCYDFTPRY